MNTATTTKPLPTRAQLRAGQRVRTNAAYGRTISSTPRSGVLVKPLTWIDGLWAVQVDGLPRDTGRWMIHANWLEAV